MKLQYHCKNTRRRQLVQSSGTPLNGIDYLEVVDPGPSAPPEDRQQVLQLYFIKEDSLGTLGVDNFLLEGGVRIQGIQILDVDIDGADASLLLLTLDHWGDFSNYRLRLVHSDDPDEVPAGFDPVLAEVEFSFKVQCPSEFDCPSKPECQEQLLPAPELDYLAKDYASFRQLMLDRLAVTLPDWQERNPADIGITIVETLAYAADYASYAQDATLTESYLDTARRRSSVRRHGRLLDYYLHEGCNARCWIVLQVAVDLSPVPPETSVLPAGTALFSNATSGAVINPAEADEILEEKKPVVFETMHSIQDLRTARNEMLFYTWGDDRCCLPKGATRAWLHDSALNLGLSKGDVIVFEEVLGPQSGLPADADPQHRHAVRLIADPVEKIDPLNGEVVVEIQWFNEDALPFPLCLWELDDGEGGVQYVSVARGNVVLADHGRSFSFFDISAASINQDRGLLPYIVPTEDFYRPRLTQTDITYQSDYSDSATRKQAASYVLQQDPANALAAVNLHDGTETWFPKWDLLNSHRFANEFVVEMDEDRRAYLRFGDDVMGKLPSAGNEFRARYRVGNGRAGNVGAESISHIITNLSDITLIRNPLPAVGGSDPEPLRQARIYAPQSFRSQRRAVTEEDYAEVSQSHPEVQRAVATRRWTGSWYTMFITVDRINGLPIDYEFEQRLRQYIEAYRLAGHDLEVDVPRFIPLDIAMSVCVKPGYYIADVKLALLEIFSSKTLHDGRNGFFHADNFTFGQPFYLSHLISTVMAVPGVKWVDIEESYEKPLHLFQRWGEVKDDYVGQGYIGMDRLEIARLDNDPNQPENGRIEFYMMGGV